jgi:hypothetical protein
MTSLVGLCQRALPFVLILAKLVWGCQRFVPNFCGVVLEQPWKQHHGRALHHVLSSTCALVDATCGSDVLGARTSYVLLKMGRDVTL